MLNDTCGRLSACWKRWAPRCRYSIQCIVWATSNRLAHRDCALLQRLRRQELLHAIGIHQVMCLDRLHGRRCSARCAMQSTRRPTGQLWGLRRAEILCDRDGHPEIESHFPPFEVASIQYPTISYYQSKI